MFLPEHVHECHACDGEGCVEVGYEDPDDGTMWQWELPLGLSRV
jgi:hypothetical protein